MIMIPSNVIDTVGGSATCILDKNERERERDYTSSLQFCPVIDPFSLFLRSIIRIPRG